MNFKLIKTIYFKELREVMRDQRMLLLVILMPFFIYPVLFTIIGSIGKSQAKKMGQEKITVLMSPEAEHTSIYDILKQDPTLDLQLKVFDRKAIDTIKNTIGIQLDASYQQKLDGNETAGIQILGDQSRDLIENRTRQIRNRIEQLSNQVLQERLAAVQLNEEFVEPIRISTVDLASKEAKFGKAIGGFLPLLLLLFIFMGSVYIAIDITAGEKERKTLQTLFTAPVKIREIIAGKFLAVFTIGIVSAAMNLLSLIVAFMIQIKLLGVSTSKLALAISPQGVAWLLLLILFSTIFISALCLGVVLLANSYKEAQSYVSPLMMMILIPCILVTMPGMELTASTALIPVFNIGLAFASIVKGSFDVGLVAMVTAFSVLYAFIALYLASLIFNNENVVTGEQVSFKAIFKR